ncbi:hypothetical protein [Streptomyces marincola]|uniref:hypothetical protein n=1 Tax=Streptomyces marincola TaxID=2878388 RepID=UPI001CF58A52|nr:hypothetical protein [Streptomyces marincola]UCM89439.1 hypothetical protein LC193_16605 [Streptomyces marincola]
MSTPGGGDQHPEAIERLLAAALRARAETVTADDLRAPRPPSAHAPRRLRVLSGRATAAALLGLAAAVVAALLALGGRAPEPPPTRPAGVPSDLPLPHQEATPAPVPAPSPQPLDPREFPSDGGEDAGSHPNVPVEAVEPVRPDDGMP